VTRTIGPPVHGAAPRTRRPAWLPTLAAFAAIALFVTAGNWQHRRMLEKDAVQARMDAMAAIAPVPLPLSVADWAAWRYRQVRLVGVYDAAHQILIDNRVHAGRVGFDVVTPLDLRDGRIVLVDRGFVPAGPSRRELPSAPPPSGPVDVTGRIDIPPARYFELGGHAAPAGMVWQHLDPARFAKATGIDVLPIVVSALGAGDDALVRESALPDVDAERNLSYMLQWYAFAALAAGLWVWFTLLPRLRARRGR
jgi:surfeit locus 1 family protein